MSLFAIGDLHGCPDELERPPRRDRTGRDDTIVFLGDYVDRGPARPALVDRLLALRSEAFTAVFLRGNHEDMLLAHLGIAGRHGDVYLRTAAAPTLASYGIPAGTPRPCQPGLLPAEHVEFFRALPSCTTLPAPFLFVHAGIRPGVALADQDEEDLLWIREEFFSQPHALPYTVVFGHTPTREARIDLPYRIGLDTGLVYGNKLSCLDARRPTPRPGGARRPAATTRDLAPAFAAAHL